MRFSVVTISFNQAAYLREAMESVLSQKGVEIEYIVCDPGSTDGSRELIASFDDPRIVKLFDPDDGPADGLNKGFARATGDIFYYLNSDDVVLPGAFAAMADYFRDHPAIDVVCGHAEVIDARGNRLRKVWSHPFTPYRVAVGAAIQIQPSTFIRAAAFRASGGFDSADRANWDGGLLTSLHLAGARFATVDRVLSLYRLHDESLTGSGDRIAQHRDNARRNFERLTGRAPTRLDGWAARGLRYWRHLTHPQQTFERLRRGPLFKWSRKVGRWN